MARLIPAIDPHSISLKPERDVACRLMEQLPADAVVYHSYPWTKEKRNDRGCSVLKEGEADFVIVFPDIGIVVLEVKGGAVQYHSHDHSWYRTLPSGGLRYIKDPFEQARKNLHVLSNQILETSFPYQEQLPCAYGYAVVFPDCDYSGPMPPGADRSIIFGVKELPHIGSRLAEMLRKWSPLKKPRSLSREDLDGIMKGLSPSFNLLPMLFRKVEEQEERLFRLTEDQIRVLDYLELHNRVAVQGVAGSGKTMLAMTKAQRFADKGLKTLFVCFNRRLAEWLGSTLPESYLDRITVANFHHLCFQFCKKAGIPFEIGDDPAHFWRYDAPDLLLSALEAVEDRFDAVVVDEGQDFYPEWWIPLDELTDGEQGAFFLFYDPAQNLYLGDDFVSPIQIPPITLSVNCRNTKSIASYCGEMCDRDIAVHPLAPEGDKVVVRKAEFGEEQVRICRDTVKEWLRAGGLKPSQTAILSPYRKEKSSLKDLDKILPKVPLVQDFEKWKADEGVYLSTVRSFKGLEADAIIIIDCPEPGTKEHFTSTDYYVGSSRAKHLLVVVFR